MAHNEIAEIAGSQFAKMQNLIEINLDYNKLTDVPATAFEDCPELKYVFIRNNMVSFQKNLTLCPIIKSDRIDR